MAILETILAGGLTGVLGSLFTSLFSFFNQKQKNKHDIAMKKLDTESMIREAEINIKRTELETKADLAKLDAELEKVEAENFTETIRQNAVEKLSNSTLNKLLANKWSLPFGIFLAVLFGLLDFIKGIIRPGMTLYMTVLVTMIYISSKEILNKAGIDPNVEQALELVNYIIETILYVFVTMSLWWFGERGPERIMRRQQNNFNG